MFLSTESSSEFSKMMSLNQDLNEETRAQGTKKTLGTTEFDVGCMSVQVCIYTGICMCVCMQVCVYRCICIQVCAVMCMCVYGCVCTGMSVCIQACVICACVYRCV